MHPFICLQLFKGTFYYCDGDSEVTTKEECVQRNVGKWVNQQYNFDNLPQVTYKTFSSFYLFACDV